MGGAPSSAAPGRCRHAGVFGEPGTGAHATRIGGLAAVDLIGTAAFAAVGARLVTGQVSALGFAVAFLILMIAAVLAHEAFCVNTRLGAAIFGRPWPGPKKEAPRRGAAAAAT